MEVDFLQVRLCKGIVDSGSESETRREMMDGGTPRPHGEIDGSSCPKHLRYRRLMLHTRMVKH